MKSQIRLLIAVSNHYPHCWVQWARFRLHAITTSGMNAYVYDEDDRSTSPGSEGNYLDQRACFSLPKLCAIKGA